MSLRPHHWRQRWRRWVPALAFFLLNLLAALAYSLAGVGDQANLEQQRLVSAQSRLAELETQREALRTQVEEVKENRRRIEALYTDRLSTQEQRLTRAIAELRRLARQSGLAPNRVQYPEEDIGEFGLVQKSFIFTVAGSYAELRRLINALELTDSFLTLEEIRLNGGADTQELNIALRLSTLFTEGEDSLEVAAAGGVP